MVKQVQKNQERHFQNFTHGSCSSTAAKEKKERIRNKEYYLVQR